ncbi:MAG TPA: 3-methyl-2-oxobutanoate hydroxymethyltransferase [Candidatus Nanopelagicaceae bacterium]|nr:3-methyl-2-oxobutanoate hydroxymethyltransferase [Candidatus Nanopelagicaceae bacterium]
MGSPPLFGSARTHRVTVLDIQAAKVSGEKWPMLTSYDALTAEIFDAAGVPVLLVGDSVANNLLGYENTIGVSVEELIPLARAVVRGSLSALVVADLPFGSYEASPEQALATSIRFFKDCGVQAVKLEGGARVLPQVRALTNSGIPVMGHLGLTPQSVHALGGYRVQGRGEAGERLLEDALALQDAGAFAIVLELVPSELADQVTSALKIPTIGIGAGAACDGQVLVYTDLLGLTANPPRLSRQYADLREAMTTAVRAWAADVGSGSFPGVNESFE